MQSINKKFIKGVTILILFTVCIINVKCGTPESNPSSGNYEAFTVAFSKTGDKVSGYYEDYRGEEQGSSPSFSCLFYFQGVKTGTAYSITVYSNSLEKITTGTLTPGDFNSSPIIKLVLKENPPGCIQINEFKKEQVYYLDNKSEFISININVFLKLVKVL